MRGFDFRIIAAEHSTDINIGREGRESFKGERGEEREQESKAYVNEYEGESAEREAGKEREERT